MGTLGEDLLALADHLAAESARLKAAAERAQAAEDLRKAKRLTALKQMVVNLQEVDEEPTKPARLRKLADVVMEYEHEAEALGLPSGQFAGQLVDTLREAAA